MYKLLLIFGIIVSIQSSCIAQSKTKIEVTATTLKSTRSLVTASDGVVVHYQDTIIKADNASFNKDKKLLILDGHVEVIGYNGSKEHTKHMEIHLESKEIHFEKLFFVSANDIWIYSQEAFSKDGNYTLGQSVLSSCNMQNPLWKMTFSSSNYNSDEKYIHLYNTKVYFLDIPIFYFPYFAFSTEQTRTSGLLFPLFGSSSGEGFVYEQPIYWAIAPNLDLEFNPQIRTERSLGIYSTLRFVDTNHSSGTLRVGYFKDTKAYQERENTQETEHYGLEFLYDSTKLISHYFTPNFKDGIYINMTLLNDIDYLNLQKDRLEHFKSIPLQESKLNYFLKNNEYYFGLNTKYFIDTRKDDNDDTLQILPSLQFHKYLQSFIWDNLTYSMNLNFNHYYRKKGATLKQAAFKLPLEFTASFFDDYLKVSVQEELYYSKLLFENGNYLYPDFQYYSNIHTVKFFTDLTKNYTAYSHVIQPSLKYVKPGNENAKPVTFDKLTLEQKKLFTVGLPEEHIAFSLSQYLYDSKMNLNFYQRFSQNYYLNRSYKWADLNNEMQYNWYQWQLYNALTYVYEFKKIRESSTYISFKNDEYYFKVGHTYKQILPDQLDVVSANDFNFNFGYTVNDNINLMGSVTLDLDNTTNRQWKLGGTYKEDCWSMTAIFSEDMTPRPSGFTRNNSFYLQFNFIPFINLGSGE